MTTITVSTAELKRHLAIVKAASAPKSYISALAGVRLEAEADGLTMTCTDLELTATATISGHGPSEPAATAVSAKALADALPAGKGTTTLRWEEDGQSNLVVTVDNGPGHPTATVPTLPLKEWPNMAKVIGEAPTMHAVTTSAVDDVCQVVSTDRARPILCQVYFDKGKAVGTDSYRLVIAENGVPAELDGMVDGRVLKLALKAAKLDKSSGSTAMAVGIGKDHATVRAGAFTFHHRLQHGDFPAYERLVPAELPHRIDLAEALPAVKAADKVIRDASPVRIVATDDSVTASAVVDNVEVMRQTFPKGRTDVVLTVAFNPTYLATALAMSIDGLLEVTDALKPAVLRTANGVHLLMPVRIS